MKTEFKDTICPRTGKPCVLGCFDNISQIKCDPLKKLAEEELGHPIPDEYWTREARDFYKIYFHARNYGFEGKFGMISAISDLKK